MLQQRFSITRMKAFLWSIAAVTLVVALLSGGCGASDGDSDRDTSPMDTADTTTSDSALDMASDTTRDAIDDTFEEILDIQTDSSTDTSTETDPRDTQFELSDSPNPDQRDDSDATNIPSWPEGRTISADQVWEHVQVGDPTMLLLNVADEEFYYLGQIENSLMIPWDLLPSRLDEVDPTRNIVVYCRRGVRSESAYTTLVENNYEHVWILEGGLEKWIELGYPIVE